MYLCAFVGSLLPPPPARPHPLSLSFFGALSYFHFVFFSVAPAVALFAAHARPACAPCSSPCYPSLAALCPLPRLFPLPSAGSLRVLPVFLLPPSLPSPRCHSCVPRARSNPAFLCRAYPVPWWLTYPCVFPSVPVPLLFGDAMVHCVGGGGYLRTRLWPCSGTG